MRVRCGLGVLQTQRETRTNDETHSCSQESNVKYSVLRSQCDRRVEYKYSRNGSAHTYSQHHYDGSQKKKSEVKMQRRPLVALIRC